MNHRWQWRKIEIINAKTKIMLVRQYII